MENSERYKKLVLLHSNDMHGDFLAENVDDKLVGGVSMLSGYISRVKQEEDNVLYCVAGDMFRGSIIDSEYMGLSTIEIMNMLAPDVVTIGNHESDYGLAHLLFIEKCATFPIINANLFIKMNGKRLFSPYKIIEIGGMKVLFIGILTEDIIKSTRTDSVIGGLVDINDAVEEISRICKTYNAIDIDFTVLLTHIGFDKDKELASKLDPSLGVDVIIGGHSHTFLTKPEKVNDILIVQAGTGTDQIGRFDIVVDTENNCVENYMWTPVPINAETCPRDLKMEELVKNLKNKTDLKYGRTLRRLKCELHHDNRFSQTTLGSFVADIFKMKTKVDIFLMGSGSIRVRKLGPIITLQDVIEAFPFKNEIYELKVTGKQLKQIMLHVYRDDAFNENIDSEFYELSSGLYCVYNKKLHKIEQLAYEGKDVEDEQVFSFGICHFDKTNFKDFYGLEPEEVYKNMQPKKMNLISDELFQTYLDSDEQLPEYPSKERLVVVE